MRRNLQAKARDFSSALEIGSHWRVVARSDLCFKRIILAANLRMVCKGVRLEAGRDHWRNLARSENESSGSEKGGHILDILQRERQQDFMMD